MATKENKSGVDRWTSNGHGVKLGPQTAAQKKAIAEVNAELAAQKKTRKPAKKK